MGLRNVSQEVAALAYAIQDALEIGESLPLPPSGGYPRFSLSVITVVQTILSRHFYLYCSCNSVPVER